MRHLLSKMQPVQRDENPWMRKHVDKSIPMVELFIVLLSAKCFFHKHLKWDELQRLNEGFVLYFCIWRETSVKKTKTEEPSTVTPCSPKRRFPKEKNWYGGVRMKTRIKECSSNQWFPFWACKEFTSPWIIYCRRNIFISIVVCWFINQVNSSSLSNTQYFNPLCNKT